MLSWIDPGIYASIVLVLQVSQATRKHEMANDKSICSRTPDNSNPGRWKRIMHDKPPYIKSSSISLFSVSTCNYKIKVQNNSPVTLRTNTEINKPISKEQKCLQPLPYGCMHQHSSQIAIYIYVCKDTSVNNGYQCESVQKL